VGDTTRGRRRRRRRRIVGDRGHRASGVRCARRPSGHGAAAERHHGGATGNDRRVPPAGQADPVAAPRRRQPVPGTGRPTLRGRPSAAQARGGRAARVPLHGRAQRHSPVRRVPVERARAVRPDGDADEGNAAGRGTGRCDRGRDVVIVCAVGGWRTNPVQDGHGHSRTGRAAQVHRSQPSVLRRTATEAAQQRRGRSAVRARLVDAGRTRYLRRGLQSLRNPLLPHGQDQIFELFLNSSRSSAQSTRNDDLCAHFTSVAILSVCKL